ncbi:MAG: hypothetical protein HKO61_13670 [Flavobacteriaceae bacterium]|nr:hypothetical protein [Flavobacteriaceae bacterium]
MSHLSNKAKHYGLIALKVLILAATFWFIYSRLSSLENTAWDTFRTALSGLNLFYILFFLLLAVLNWLLEIRKWQMLVTKIEKIRLQDAVKQCLSALSAGLWTPNRIGEYGIKPLYFPKQQRKKIMALNLLSNLSQMLATILFGLPGLLYFLYRYNIEVPAWKPLSLLFLIAAMLMAGYYFRKRQLLIQGLSLENLVGFTRRISLRIRWQVILLSVTRYVVFASSFYFLLRFFGTDIEFLNAAPLITSMYLIASVLPSFFFSEVAIKGGVALWIFSVAGYDEIPVLCTAMAMWILNFVLPAIIGAFFVGKFKLVSQ